MLRKSFWAVLALLLILGIAPAGAAGPVRDKHVEAELVSELSGLKPGSTQSVGILLRMDEHWHTYWQNPGDSGLPTEVKWQLPPGFEAGPLQWPAPERSELAGIASLAYEGRVLLISELKIPATLKPGEQVTLAADVKWLMCEDTCIPGKARVDLALPVTEEPAPTSQAPEFASTRKLLPTPIEGVRAEARVTDMSVLLDLSLPPDVTVGDKLEFYPTEGTWLDLAADQKLTRAGDGYRLELRRSAESEAPKALKGILVSPGTWAIPLDLAVSTGGSAAPASAPPGEVRSSLGEVKSLPVALLFAFLGGMALNLMPCVFPVLSLKVMSFMEHGSHGRGIRQALIFSLGVLVSFWAIVALLLGLRAAGQELGWGFQLQSTSFVAFVACLFFLMALNLLGVFEVGLGLTRLGDVAESGSGSWGSFLSGVLATIVATPCTAPYMGSAIGYSLTQPVWAVFLVFTALAVGMASPYVVLASWPALLARLPRPGAWMETFKQVLAFPLLLTVVYFAWVLDRQAGSEAVAALLAGMVLLGMAAWMYGKWGMSDRFVPRALSFALFVLALSVAIAGSSRLAAVPAAAGTTHGSALWEPWSPERQEALLAEGRPVLLDFTAAWCLSCQVNERVALANAEVEKALRDRGVATLKADWTNRDEKITKALESFGRSGVPLYVLYSGKPGEAPKILPEVLTPGVVLEALAELPAPAQAGL